MPKKKLIFDTNYLVYLAKEKRMEKLEELFKLYDCFIIDITFKEIGRLVKGKHKQRVLFLLEFLKKKIGEGKLRVIKAKTNDVDMEILKLVEKKFNVATFDKELHKAIKKLVKEKNLKIEILKAKI